VSASLLANAPVPSPDLSADGHFYRSAEDDRLLIRFAGAAAAGRSLEVRRLVGTRPLAREAVRWSDEPWTRGTYLILGPGQLLDWGGRLGERHGRIHFAGAERSTLKSYMDGAVRAGNEVAEEILVHMAG
jgi:Flavin containing amine oxidoreductase